MKKILLSISAIALLAITIVSCGSKSDPKEVAINFTKAMNSLDYETAKKYGTPETDTLLDMLASFSGMMPMSDSLKDANKNNKVEVKNVKEEGDKATVTIVNGDKGEEDMEMMKKDGVWLVHMSKKMGEGMPADTGTEPVPDAEPVSGKDSVSVSTPN